MGKRPAEVELFVGNMGSIQREDAAFYAKRRIANHGNRTRTNSGDYNAVNQLLKSVVRENCTLRSAGAGAGDRSGHPVVVRNHDPYSDLIVSQCTLHNKDLKLPKICLGRG